MLAMMAMLDTKKPVSVPGSWNLVWDEEFNYRGLPDPKKWGYEVGYIRNGEAQYYTDKRAENAFVADGHLTLTGLQDNSEGHKVTSGSITTQGKFAFKYGLIEVRAKVPTGKGTWPAIWTLGTNINKIGWPRCGEIDIMEYVGFDPNKVHGTCHWNRKSDSQHDSLGKETELVDVWKDYHVYAVDWTPDAIDFYVDKTLYHHFVIDQNGYTDSPFNADHYLILNLALGGAWGGEIDSAIYPSKFEVDYVRYYKRK